MFPSLRARLAPSSSTTQYTLGVLSMVIIFLAIAWPEPCDPTLRVLKVPTAQTLTVGAVVHHACNFYWHYEDSGGENHAGRRLLVSAAGGSLAGAATYIFLGPKLRRAIPRGCVCYDDEDDGNIFGLGGDVLKEEEL
ncbi:hypothetical protein SBRCBS47491_001915 [Sporothrix bragantina]|uniref:Uncharacterized protein n=1 Tax=Sporothrix bragantina TaxID=671064 RepID=A0ABP0B2K1_9PEZI